MDSYRCIDWVARTLPARSRHNLCRKAARQAHFRHQHTRSVLTQYRSFSSSITPQSDVSPKSSPIQSEKPSEISDALSKIFQNHAAPTGNARAPSDDRLPFRRREVATARERPSSIGSDAMSFDLSPRPPNTTSLFDLLDASNSIKKGPPPLDLGPAPFKCGPVLGRTVHVAQARGDVGAAFRRLNALVARNKIRQDFYAQRFHERGGLRRKRLKSQRYRVRFKAAFKEMVGRVQQMRKMGW